MSGGFLPAGVAFATQRAVRSLPANAEVFQVGRMLARGTEAMRLCVRGLEVADVVPLLERLQWSGDTVALGALLHSLGERTASINLALDVDEGVRPGIGLECRLPSDPDSANAFLDSLEVSGLATREKRAALDRFPGVSVPARDDTPWPAHLTRAAAFLGPGYLSVCRRWVHHIKLVFDGRAVTAAKAYLALGHTFVTRSRE
jgi:hypothetical protein